MDRTLSIHRDDPHHAWSTDELWSCCYDHGDTCPHTSDDRVCVLPPGHDGDHGMYPSAKRDLTGLRIVHQILEVTEA